MTSEKYTDTDEYQQEIAEQYKKRRAIFSLSEVVKTLDALGINVNSESITEATSGNMNATYLTPKLVIKMNKGREVVDYLANKIISDKISDNFPVVKVIAYDYFQKTNYEALVMVRAKGITLLDDLLELDFQTQQQLFRQVLKVVKAMSEITFNDFGNVNSSKSYPTYSDYLKFTFTQNITQISEKKLIKESDIDQIEKYFLKHVDIFNNEIPVFVHADLHMGNIMHNKEELTAIIDFDHSLKAPIVRALVPLLGMIDEPSQFVEGTVDFPKYKRKNLYKLLPILREELADVFADPLLLEKLNILYIREATDLIAGNWSFGLNKVLIEGIVSRELNADNLAESYYGKVLQYL
jgi:hypothetical protein